MWLSDAIVWLYAQQRAAHEVLIHSLEALAAGDGMLAGFALIAASFVYGVVHAAGPGHGKAVITAYMATQPEDRRRVVPISFAAAAMQGVTAVVLVYGLVHLAGWLPRETQDAVLWSERAAFGLAALLGLVLVVRGLRAIIGRVVADPSDHAATCRHHHAPDLADIERAGSWWTRAGLVIAIGLRPCSGAVLVLVLARLLGLGWAGVAAVAAMSFGTALVISGLALASSTFRRWIARWSARRGPWAAYVAEGGAVLGGLLLLVVGAGLLERSFAVATHPLGL